MILIGLCSGGKVHVETMTSLIGAMNTLRENGVDAGLSCQTGGYKSHNMNRLVDEAIKLGASHLMVVDPDMIFPSSGIIRLLDNDKDIVGGNYNVRGNPQGNPGLSVVKLLDDKGEFYNAPSSSIPKELFVCGGLGLGFTMIKTKVFELLQRPYFRDSENAEGEHHTEDIEFCIKARDTGFMVWCNPGIKIGHVGLTVY